jgi:hypothetical protein
MVSARPWLLCPPQKNPGTHCTGDWVSPRVSLDGRGECHLSVRFDSRNVHPVASLYTSYVEGHNSNYEPSQNYLLIFCLSYLNIVSFSAILTFLNSKYTFCLLWNPPPWTASPLGAWFPQLRHWYRPNNFNAYIKCCYSMYVTTRMNKCDMYGTNVIAEVTKRSVRPTEVFRY